MLKRTIFGTLIASFLATGLVQAADLRPIVKAPAPVVTAYNWSGGYVGVHAGAGWADNRFYDTIGGADIGRFTAQGYFGGGQVGYNWQRERWVLGVEAEGSAAHLRRGQFGNFCGFGNFGGIFIPGCGGFGGFGGGIFGGCAPFVGCGGTFGARVEALGLFTARAGYTWDRTLLYVKAGGAVARETYVIDVPGVLSITPTDTRFGWVVGAGVEYGITANWSAKVEYNYVDLGTKRFDLTSAGGIRFVVDHSQQLHLAKAGINYRF